MRGIFTDKHPRRAINNIHVDKQLVFIVCHDDDIPRDHQHQLDEQQCQRQPDGVSPTGPEYDYRWHLWQQQIMYRLGIWTVLFSMGLLWVFRHVLLANLAVSAQLWDM